MTCSICTTTTTTPFALSIDQYCCSTCFTHALKNLRVDIIENKYHIYFINIKNITGTYVPNLIQRNPCHTDIIKSAITSAQFDALPVVHKTFETLVVKGNPKKNSFIEFF
jgi:hypothetical protein